MRILLLASTDPYRNLAAEEYLLAHADDEVFMIWRNDSAVVIGRNQNAWAEVNVPYTEVSGIAVVRRLSGGGAVFHDLGNVNYSFIVPRDAGGIDFARYTAPIRRALAALGADAVLDGRNDLTVGGAKISGSAQAVYRRPDGTERLLHHGTLLLGADLSRMSGALRVSPGKLRSKGVASVRSRVTNLRDVPGFPPMAPEEFMEYLASSMYTGPGAYRRPLSEEEAAGIGALREEKYATWEWNYGASAAHDAERSKRFPFGSVGIAYSAAHGRLTAVRIRGDFFGERGVDELEAALCGVPLQTDAVAAALGALAHPVGEYIAGADAAALVGLLFGEPEDNS
jgi:lipoate-protein ligase A